MPTRLTWCQRGFCLLLLYDQLSLTYNETITQTKESMDGRKDCVIFATKAGRKCYFALNEHTQTKAKLFYTEYAFLGPEYDPIRGHQASVKEQDCRLMAVVGVDSHLLLLFIGTTTRNK